MHVEVSNDWSPTDRVRVAAFEEFAESLGLTKSQLLERLIFRLPTCTELTLRDALARPGDDYTRGRILTLEILLETPLRDSAAPRETACKEGAAA